MKKILFILKYFGGKNWHEGIDKPNLYQYIYKWRLGLKTINEIYELTIE